RDGVVRRYSYDESIRLYQRRIESAEARYEDGDVVDAEVVHCRLRIGQLRRSYFARYGWSAMRVGDRPGLLAGEFAGEVAAFLRRVVQVVPEPDAPGHSVRFALLADRAHHQVYYVRRADTDDKALWLLYLYRFSGLEACPGRASFFSTLKLLQSVADKSDSVEQVLGFHHTTDCGIILSGTRSPAEQAPREGAPKVEWLDFAAVDGDPLQAAFSALRRGRLSDALVRFTEAYEAQPFRRAAYVGAGVVADQLGAFEAAETAALMGVRYLPDDNFLRHHLALVELRLGRLKDVSRTLHILQDRVPGAASNRLLAGLAALSGDRWLRGLRDVRNALYELDGYDPDLAHAARDLLSLVVWGSIVMVCGLTLSLASYVASYVGFSWPFGLSIAVLLGGVTLTAGAALSTRTRVHRLIRAPSGWGLRLSNPRCFRDAAEACGIEGVARDY
ncbi:MAG TPA: hypothetical protein DFR83_24625, partial [Deltaproteobacteria bacterium]|nr:hypothetical protein [Deltaproteobacteria bacterium]